MASMTETSRRRVMALVEEETSMLNRKAMELSEAHWAAAEHDLMGESGLGEVLLKMQHLEEQITAMQAERQALEHKAKWRETPPSAKDYHEAGFTWVMANNMGRLDYYGGPGLPRVFNRVLKTKWDLEVFKRLDDRMQLLKVHEVLSQVAHAVSREIALAGSYAEAREQYSKFYQLLRRAGGNDMPPLLAEIADMPALLPPGQEERAND